MIYLKRGLAIVLPIIFILGLKPSSKMNNINQNKTFTNKYISTSDSIKLLRGPCPRPFISFSKEGGVIKTDHLPYEFKETITAITNNTPPVAVFQHVWLDLNNLGHNYEEYHFDHKLSEGKHTILVRAKSLCNDGYTTYAQRKQHIKIVKVSK